jgi:hypothetical protein
MQRLVYIIVVFSAFAIAGCGTKKARLPKQEVPIAINIRTDNVNRLGSAHLDYFRFQLLNDLKNFQRVDLTLVEADENPEIVFDLNIENFQIWPRDERTSRRTLRQNVQVGTDRAGKPVYQTVTASVDITETQIRSNGRFVTRLTFKGLTPTDVFERTFNPNYNYRSISTSNIQGDSRAIDPSLYSVGAFNIEPREDEFLLLLTKQELNRRIADEIRKHYQ